METVWVLVPSDLHEPEISKSFINEDTKKFFFGFNDNILQFKFPSVYFEPVPVDVCVTATDLLVFIFFFHVRSYK